AHGAKIINLFEFRPVQVAYTENHCSSPEMYQTIREALHQLGTFEDIIQDGHVRPGIAGLWFSDAADVWDDNCSPFDAAKRTLYIAIRHQQLPLDVVVEGDDLSAYKVIYLTDQHVSRAASKPLAEWVRAGGQLFATAGGGMFDELNQPDSMLRELFGVQQQQMVEAKEPIHLEKQDLPFAEPMEMVHWGPERPARRERPARGTMPVFGAFSRMRVRDAEIEARFSDGSPAVTTKSSGTGQAVYCAFLPGLTY